MIKIEIFGGVLWLGGLIAYIAIPVDKYLSIFIASWVAFGVLILGVLIVMAALTAIIISGNKSKANQDGEE